MQAKTVTDSLKSFINSLSLSDQVDSVKSVSDQVDSVKSVSDQVDLITSSPLANQIMIYHKRSYSLCSLS